MLYHFAGDGFVAVVEQGGSPERSHSFVALDRIESHSPADFVNRQNAILDQVCNRSKGEVIPLGDLFGCFPRLNFHESSEVSGFGWDRSVPILWSPLKTQQKVRPGGFAGR